MAAWRNATQLTQGWAFCRQAASASSDHRPSTADWCALGEMPNGLTAAAARRSLGEWRLDDPALDFDASVWWFKLDFGVNFVANLPAASDATTEHWLHFDGLATLCQVWLNDQLLVQSDNMFLAHAVPVSSALLVGTNCLVIRCDALTNALAVKRPRPQWRTPMVAHQQLRWLRTTLLGRTPGWSPPAAVVGPWRPVWLEARQAHQLVAVQLHASVGASGAGQITAALEFHQGCNPRYSYAVVVRRLQGPKEGPKEGVGLKKSEHWRTILLLFSEQSNDYLIADNALFSSEKIAATIDIPQPALWWPHTHGLPARYSVSLEVCMASGETTERVLGHVGFRQVALDDTHGGFGLRINQTPVFCRGACWMPLDVVTLSAPRADLRLALTQARDAGMNMLRLAGSTVYETDDFYDLCDELGLMVWQDLMFSNMDYPSGQGDAGQNFLRSATAEVSQVLQRLRPHPSVAVLCGNSEVAQQAAMWGAPRTQWAPALFHHTFADLAQASLPEALYWPSSAWGGAFPHQAGAGTSSYYGVGAYKRDLADAVASQVRFATECLAFANIPGASTLRRSPAGEVPQVHAPAWKARVYRDLSVGWDFDDVRDHYLERLLGWRPDQLRAIDPPRYLTLGRAVTAEVMSRTMALWRTPVARCKGALVWFLRDLWAGAGCGLVDDAGVPKSVMHALSRVQQPLLAVIEDQGLNGLVLHLVNETATPKSGHVAIQVYQHGETCMAQGSVAVQVPARGHLSLPVLDALPGFMDLTGAYQFGPAAQDLVVAQWVIKGEAEAEKEAEKESVQALYFDPAQMLQFNGSPGLSAQSQRCADGSVEVRISTRAAAYGVHFESPGWQPSDEFFHLPPGGHRTVLFKTNTRLQGEQKRPAHWYATVCALNVRQTYPVLDKES